MKNFWIGVVAGAVSTVLVCAVLFAAVNIALAQRARASIENGEPPPPPPIVMRGLFGSRGEVGTVDELNAQTIILKARDGIKKTVVLSDETVIYRGQTKIAWDDLSKGQRILVIGAVQSDGTIKAKWIRVFSTSMLQSEHSGL